MPTRCRSVLKELPERCLILKVCNLGSHQLFSEQVDLSSHVLCFGPGEKLVVAGQRGRKWKDEAGSGRWPHNKPQAASFPTYCSELDPALLQPGNRL